MNFIIKIFASGLGTGYCPIAPGTAGSALAAGLILLCGPWWSIPMALASAGLIFFFGVFACTRAEKFWGHDSGRMVIDEIAGMFLALSLCRISLWQVAAGFFLFRVLDIVKPPPARSAERLPAGWGVMTDDMVAGAYAALILWIISLWM